MSSILANVLEQIHKLAQKWDLPLEWFFSLNDYARDRFGFWGQLALNLAIFYLAFLILTRLLKTGFDMTKYVVLPGLILCGITSYFLPYAFIHLLPFCIAIMILINLLRPS